MAKRLSKSDFEKLADFRFRLRTFMRFSEEAARSVGLTPGQHQLLLAIEGYPDRDHATPAELAERLQLRHHSCLGLIQRSESGGLLYRRDHPTDRRSFYVHLTEKGLDLLDKLTSLHQQELKQLGLLQWVEPANKDEGGNTL